METRASYLLVGSFVLALMVGAVIFVIWITGTTTEQTERYYMRFSESVTGLQVGSQVRFRGIPVGEVASINIVENEKNPNLPIEIEVAADIKADTPIRENTRAVLEIQGITGVSYIQLTSEPGPSPRLRPTKETPKVYIPTKPSQLEKVFHNFPELLAEMTKLAIQGTKLLNDENLKKISQSLDNFESITSNMAKESKDITLFIKRGTEVLDKAGPAVDNVSQAARAMRDASREVETLIAANQQPIADFTSSGLYQLTQFLVEARQLVAAFMRISRKLENNPSRFFFGDELKGYTPK